MACKAKCSEQAGKEVQMALSNRNRILIAVLKEREEKLLAEKKMADDAATKNLIRKHKISPEDLQNMIRQQQKKNEEIIKRREEEIGEGNSKGRRGDKESSR